MRIIAIGEEVLIQGLSLAGCEVVAGGDPRQVLEAWDHIGDDVAVAVLSPAAARLVAGRPAPPRLLTVVIPT